MRSVRYEPQFSDCGFVVVIAQRGPPDTIPWLFCVRMNSNLQPMATIGQEGKLAG